MIKRAAFWTWMLETHLFAQAIVFGGRLAQGRAYDLAAFAEAVVLGLIPGIGFALFAPKAVEKVHEQLYEKP